MPHTEPAPGRRGQLREAWLSGPDGLLVAPETPCGTGVLVLAGSSGRVDAERARLLARHGAPALPIRWFGGEGQPSAPAEVPLERIAGEVVLVAGGDDQVWPSVDFARAVARRRASHGLGTEVVTHPDAGHRTVLPGEPRVTAGMVMARGGTPAADAELGEPAWPAMATVLRLPTA